MFGLMAAAFVAAAIGILPIRVGGGAERMEEPARPAEPTGATDLST